MNMLRTFFLACLSLPLVAQYTYFLTTNFQTGIPSGSWQSNGTITSSASDGLTTTATNGGSVIYKNAVTDPAGGTDLAYEVKAKLRITATGGTFSFYSRASMNALAGPAAQGTFYASELTPTVSGSGCSMVLNVYKVVSGVVTLISGGQTFACKDGMTVRYVQRHGCFWLYTSLNDFGFFGDSALGAGRPGLGARAMPSGNGILEGQLGTMEFINPSAIDPLTVRSALFDNRVDLEWPRGVDNTNGSGLIFYQIL